MTPRAVETTPHAIARRKGCCCVVVLCPHCCRQHTHGAGLGHRLAHCGRGVYELIAEGSSR